MTCVGRAVWLYISLLYFILLNLDYKESLAPFPLRLNITNHAATPTPMGQGAFLQLHWALLAAYQAGCFLPPPSKQPSATHRCLNPGGSLGPLVVRYFYTPGTVKCILLLFFLKKQMYFTWMKFAASDFSGYMILYAEFSLRLFWRNETFFAWLCITCIKLTFFPFRL